MRPPSASKRSRSSSARPFGKWLKASMPKLLHWCRTSHHPLRRVVVLHHFREHVRVMAVPVERIAADNQATDVLVEELHLRNLHLGRRLSSDSGFFPVLARNWRRCLPGSQNRNTRESQRRGLQKTPPRVRPANTSFRESIDMLRPGGLRSNPSDLRVSPWVGAWRGFTRRGFTQGTSGAGPRSDISFVLSCVLLSSDVRRALTRVRRAVLQYL
jgi:hypothetical protein